MGLMHVYVQELYQTRTIGDLQIHKVPKQIKTCNFQVESFETGLLTNLIG